MKRQLSLSTAVFGVLWLPSAFADSYHKYPYQVRGYLDQLYDKPSPSSANLGQLVTAANHVALNLGALEKVFRSVFQTLACVDSAGKYASISDAQATAAFNAALTARGLAATQTLDLSAAPDRAQIFGLLDTAITTLEKSLGTTFNATTNSQL